MNIEDILKEYKHLKKGDILGALDYASKVIKREDVITPILAKRKINA